MSAYSEICTRSTLCCFLWSGHYSDVIMSALVSQITGVSMVCLTVCSGVDKKNTSKLRVTGLCEGNSPVTAEFPHKWPVTRKMFPFDDVIMVSNNCPGTKEATLENAGKLVTWIDRSWYKVQTGSAPVSWDILNGNNRNMTWITCAILEFRNNTIC